MKIQRHTELTVYKQAFDTAMQIFEASRSFPKEETYSLTDQIRRSSRSVATSIAEGWRRRKYEAAFVNKLSEAESETAETQSWLEFAVKCCYLKAEPARELHKRYDRLIGKLVNMGNNPAPWVLRKSAGKLKVAPAYRPTRLPANGL